MSLQGIISGCIPILLLTVFFVNFSYIYVFGLLFYDSVPLAPLPLIVSAFAFVWTCLSVIWLWQYWLRPDWSPWRIISTSAINLSLSLVEFHSVRWESPSSEQYALASLVVTGVNAAVQTILATCLSLLRSRSYEPLVRSRVTNLCFCQRSSLDPAQSAVADQPSSHSRNLLQLESLYETHEDSRNEHTDKFSKAFAPVSYVLYWGNHVCRRGAGTNTKSSTSKQLGGRNLTPSSIPGLNAYYGTIWTSS